MKAHYERIEPLDDRSFNAYTYEKAEFDSPWHYHPEFELTCILSGRGVRYVGHGFENFEENDLVLLGPNLPHCWRNMGAQSGPSAAIVVHWNGDLLGRDWLSTKEFRRIEDLFRRSQLGLVFSGTDADVVRMKLLKLLELPPFERMIAFLDTLQNLALADARALTTAALNEPLRNHNHERINSVYQFVRNNYKEKITLSQIASEVHMSEEAFSRFFSKVMNKPFFAFLNEYRINAACRELIESDAPISEVALASGFETLPFFYRQFAKFKGISPKKYRDEYKIAAR